MAGRKSPYLSKPGRKKGGSGKVKRDNLARGAKMDAGTAKKPKRLGRVYRSPNVGETPERRTYGGSR